MIRPRIVFRTAIVLAVCAALYTAIWFAIASGLKGGISDWVAERRADGWTVEHGSIAMGGFPFSWQAAIETPHLAQTRLNRIFRWSGPAITLNWQPWSPRTVQYTTSGSHTFHVDPPPGNLPPDTTLTLASGQGHLVFGSQGGLDQLAILIDGATLSLPTAQKLRFNRFRAIIDTNPPANGAKPDQPHLIPSFGLDGDLFGLTLPEGQRLPLGRTIGRIALRATIMGRIPPGRASAGLPLWQQEGGTVEISRLNMGWGPLVVQATGTMALDATLQPVGALTGTIAGYGETIEALAAARLIKPGAALVGKFALGALARRPDGGGRPEIEVPLTLQNNWLYIGPVKLLQVPIIHWK